MQCMLRQCPIEVLFKDLLACHPDDAADFEPHRASIARDSDGDRHRPSNKQQCPEKDCEQTFRRQADLVRHRFIHYAWDLPCDHCSDKFTTASTFIQYKCSGRPKQIEHRRRLVERTLGLRITKRRRGERVKAKPLTDSNHATSFQQLGQDAIMVHGESFSANPQTKAMPSSALVGPAQPRSSTNSDMGFYTTTLWQQYAAADWDSPAFGWTTQS
ncbi:hypothetical protein QBC36DRAFT_108495 [Triangularia setosa]|uniref:C2H2-type domain-containing protein n=1 Tax=Triangularia setosa TaxID=2587417 RepID=A0AAN7A2I6_9PEZI|nr:hypothetical protein QBC36DRAFT_108495 [Podospora setosa]